MKQEETVNENQCGRNPPEAQAGFDAVALSGARMRD
jgi:hypothetical protein